jgi:hypothetical protein
LRRAAAAAARLAAAGRRLFEWVAACRDAGIDPDSALRRHTAEVMRTAEANAAQG